MMRAFIIAAALAAGLARGALGQQVRPDPAPVPFPPVLHLENPGDDPPAAAPVLAVPLPDPIPTEEPTSSDLPVLKPKAPRRAGESRSFIESLGGPDSAFEVVVNQGRILTTKSDLTAGRNEPLIAVGDPTVIDFTVINSRQIRITGQRIGVTDLSITTADGQTYSFEVRVVADLSLLTGTLKATFPDASVHLGQLRDHVIVEGEARDSAQISRILETIAAYLESVQAGQARKITGQQGRGLPNGLGGALDGGGGAAAPGGAAALMPGIGGPMAGAAAPELGGPLQVEGTIAPPRIINLLRVPSSQQVMLKVRVAELNRSAMRRIGANFLGVDPRTGGVVGSQIAGPVTAFGRIGSIQPNTTVSEPARQLTAGTLSALNPTQGTVFGIFQDVNFEFTLNALRQNSFLKILAEPNLVALSGHQASFLAGGEFPVPVPQVSASGVAPTITVRFREFGVRLNFVPYVLDGETIRLSVAPEVSQIDFTIATTLVSGGTPVPGLNTRKALTTVELRQGQTLAIAGLLQLTMDGTTTRIPGLGDLPILGPFFSNTSGSRTEKELVVLVTPYLIEPMAPNQVPPGPGDEVKEPNDLEFYFLNRIEGKTGIDFRSTIQWDDPLHIYRFMKLEQKYVHGPAGFSD